MLIGGLWHGASWTFVIWGGYHGLFLILNHISEKYNFNINKVLSKALTLLIVIYGWAIFRSADFTQLHSITKDLLGANGFRIHDLFFIWKHQLVFICLCFAIVLFFPNVQYWSRRIRPNLAWTLYLMIMYSVSILFINKASEFVYFKF